jgi:K+/H+ antiporter YhaU regulatory subunit KhtT
MNRVSKTEELANKLAEILERDLSKMEEAIVDWVVVQFEIEESLKKVGN